MAVLSSIQRVNKCSLRTVQGLTALTIAATRKFTLPVASMINTCDSSKDINFPLKGHLSRSLRLIRILQDDSVTKVVAGNYATYVQYRFFIKTLPPIILTMRCPYFRSLVCSLVYTTGKGYLGHSC